MGTRDPYLASRPVATPHAQRRDDSAWCGAYVRVGGDCRLSRECEGREGRPSREEEQFSSSLASSFSFSCAATFRDTGGSATMMWEMLISISWVVGENYAVHTVSHSSKAVTKINKSFFSAHHPTLTLKTFFILLKSTYRQQDASHHQHRHTFCAMRPASAGTAHDYTFKTSYLSLLVNVQDLSLLANVVDRLTTQNRKPCHVVLSEGERGLLEAHLHVLCHKLVHVSPVRGVPHHQTQLPTNHNDTPRQPPRRSTLSRSTLHDDREEPWPQGHGKERSVYSPIGSAISAAPASPASGAPVPPAPPRTPAVFANLC